MAKAKVAPVKPLIVPKLELTSVLMAARLGVFIKKAYSKELDICHLSVE